MNGICALTRNETELRNSHIYPKFVIEWMKLTGAKYLRSYTSPNKRVQDGYKVYLLSEEAEQLFSKREKWFAENIFHKYHASVFNKLEYNENLFYFSISFLWRILVLELRKPNIENFWFHELMVETEKQWRDFLYLGYYPKNFDRIHLILTDTPIDHSLPSKNVDFFLTRSLDGTTVYDDNNCSIFAKFSKFIFLAFLNDDESGMLGTKVNPIQGILQVPQKFENQHMMCFFSHRIIQYDDMALASENQQKTILQDIINNKEYYINSEAFKSMEFDYFMKEKNKNNSW